MTTRTQALQFITQDLHVQRQHRLRRIVILILCAQFLAAPLLLVPSLLPPVIGIGRFSFAVEFRYLQAVLVGASASVLLWLPFVLAWSSKPLRWRASVYVSLLALIGVTGIVIMLISFFGLRRVAVSSIFDFLREVSMSIRALVVACFGLAVIPAALRVYRGWKISDVVDPARRISRRDRFVDSVLLAALLGVIFFGGPFVDEPPGFNVLAGVFGIVIGGVVAVSVFWLFRDSSRVVFQTVVALHLFLCVAIPGVCLWLADFARSMLLPAGSGAVFIGVAVAATVLLVHVFLFRAMGFRMQQLPFERVVEVPAVKEVVDPFSD